MILRSLYTRLALSFAAILLCFGSVLGVVSYNAARMHQQEVSQTLNRGLAAHISAHNGLDGAAADTAGSTGIGELFHMLMAVNPLIEVYMLDAAGRIVMHSAPEGHLQMRQVSLAPVRAFLAGERLPVVGDNPRIAGRRDVFSVAPITRANGEPGYLYVVLAGETYTRMSQSAGLGYALTAGLWLGVAVLCCAMVAGLVIFRGITRRINRLAERVEAFTPVFGETRGTHRTDTRRDEIGRLVHSFGRMARTITRQLDELKRQDMLRRELVANVSHDLRTPLTVMHNYLETLLARADRLAPAEQADFLERAVRQSQGVARLAQQLFELARLECEEVPPQPEPFCINELLQDVGHKMQFGAAAEGVKLDIAHTRDGLKVEADIGLIERVLTNLIDNALRSTPHGGTVRLDAVLDGETVVVSVTDTGCGIAPEHLPTLFSRDSPLRRRGAGDVSRGGLGLLIVHRILALHRTTIEVESELARGTRFRFSLTAVGRCAQAA